MKYKTITRALFSFFFALVWFATPAFADPLMDAMEKELARAPQLSSVGFDPPYFVSYGVYDYKDWGHEAEFGGLLSAFDNESRRGRVEVRVGDYHFDNTIKGGMLDGWTGDTEFDFSHINLRLPMEMDEDAIRAQLWLSTDATYKAGVADYLRKKGRKIYAIDPLENLDNFSREKPVIFNAEVSDWEVDSDHWKGVAKKASALFKGYPGFTRGYVSVTFSKRIRRLVNSEGTKIKDGGRFAIVQIFAETQAPDGQKIDNFFNFNVRNEKDLPDEKTIFEKTREVAEQLLEIAAAPKLDPYTGPAILDPSLAGVFFHEAVGHRLEGERQEDADEGQTFKGKVGQKILPDFLSLFDDPTRKRFEGRDLFGHYRYDDEGVVAQKVALVEKGVLRNFLMSRSPIEGFTHSNGHGRSDGTLDPTARMGSTFVQSEKTLSDAKLEKQLIELAKKQGKPYALILKKARGGETGTSKYSFQAFKHSPVLIYKVDINTGRRSLVRGAEVVGTPLVSLNKVVAAGKSQEVFNGYCGAESGWVPVSVIAPALLISEIEIQRTSDKPVRPPILPAPFLD